MQIKRSLIAFAVSGLACGSSSTASSPDDGAANPDSAIDGNGDDTPVGDSAAADTFASDETAADSTSDIGDATLGAYPVGPYGGKEGDTLANFQWEGYRDDASDVVASTEAYGKYSMDLARTSGRRYAVLHVSEFF